MIVETHVHIASPDEKKYPRQLGNEVWGPEQEVTAEDLLRMMDAAGINKAVLAQRNRAYKFDNGYIVDAAAQYPDRFAALGMLDPLPPDAPDRLTYWVKERGMHGLRLFLTSDPPPQWLDDPRTFPVWLRAISLNIPITICMRFGMIPKLANVLQRFPNVKVALEHLGMVPLDGGPPYEAAKPLFDLAHFPNLYLKFSSVNLYASMKEPGTPKDFFQRLKDEFGAQRIMWGSNFPSTCDRGLKEQFELAQQSLAFMSEEDRRWIFSETALTLWPMLR